MLLLIGGYQYTQAIYLTVFVEETISVPIKNFLRQHKTAQS